MRFSLERKHPTRRHVCQVYSGIDLKQKEMIQVTDLRIGNYVDIFGSVSHVVPSDFNPANPNHWVTVENNEYVIKSWKPIPLTDEWLIDLGLAERGMSGYFSIDVGSRFYIANTPRGFFISIERSDDDDDSGEDEYARELDIKYVHQLQNLYHALTGKELKRKEP